MPAAAALARVQIPRPMSPMHEALWIIDQLPESKRAQFKRWIVPAIEKARARLLSEEPLSRALIGEVASLAFRTWLAARALLVSPIAEPLALAGIEADFQLGIRQAAEFLDDQDAADALYFVYAAFGLLMHLFTYLKVADPDLVADIERQKTQGAPEIVDMVATHDAEGISRALILVEAVVMVARRRDPNLRGRAIDLMRWAEQEAELGAGTLLGVDLERCYDDFGRRKGDLQEVGARQARRVVWRNGGAWAAWWLARRVRVERDVQVLADAASALADIGPAALPPVLEELRRAFPDGPAEQVETLLDGLRWLPVEDAVSVEAAGGVLALWLGHPDADLRERAVAATRPLPAQEACRILRAAEESEVDAMLRTLIADEIATRTEAPVHGAA